MEFRQGTSGTWRNFSHSGPAVTTTLTGLTANTSYQARVQAVNGETDSEWSDPSNAVSTNAETSTAPTITDVAVTSTPAAATDTYGAGETIEVTVTFSEAVTATTGTDFVLSVAGRKRAPLSSGSGTTTLVFGYTVQTGDSDDDGIWIGDQDRTLVGNRNGDPQNGTITSVDTGTAADLTHAALGQQSGHKVDASLSGSEPVDPVEPPEVTLHLSDADGEVGEGRGRRHGDSDGVAGLGDRLHGDGVGESGGPGDGRRLRAEHEPGAELRRERDREQRDGDDRAGRRRRP